MDYDKLPLYLRFNVYVLANQTLFQKPDISLKEYTGKNYI
jgi:hypothetical protein